jgi:hypothetical protein
MPACARKLRPPRPKANRSKQMAEEFSVKCRIDEAMRMEQDKPSIDDCLFHRCLKHRMVPQYNAEDGNGGECGACIALDSYTIWTDFKPGDLITHKEHGAGTVEQIIVNRRIGRVVDSEQIDYVVDCVATGLIRCEPSALTKREEAR